MDLTPRIVSSNPDPRAPCVLVLDTSGSMAGAPIASLNQGLKDLQTDLASDPVARKRVELAIVTCGGTVDVASEFSEIRDFEPPELKAYGATPLGQALDTAMDLIVERKQVYRRAGLEYYRPWLFVITDGSPTDDLRFRLATERLRAMESARSLSVFPVMVGFDADMAAMRLIAANRQPVQLREMRFGAMFQWLSASLSVVSGSAASADRDVDGPQVPLPSPEGWASW